MQICIFCAGAAINCFYYYLLWQIFDKNIFVQIDSVYLRILAVKMFFSDHHSSNHCRLNCFFVTLIKCVNLNLAETL